MQLTIDTRKGTLLVYPLSNILAIHKGSILRTKCKNIETIDNWYTEGPTNISMVKLYNFFFRPKDYISDKDTKDKWHTKRHTNNFIQDQGKINMSSVIYD